MVFVVISVGPIAVGIDLQWSCIKSFRFIVLHMLTIMIFATQTWIVTICPLAEWTEVCGNCRY